jgi:hypothetical protein
MCPKKAKYLLTALALLALATPRASAQGMDDLARRKRVLVSAPLLHGEVFHVAFTADGRFLVCFRKWGPVAVLSSEDGHLVREIDPGSEVTAFAPTSDPDLVLAAGGTRNVAGARPPLMLVRLSTGERVATIDGPEGGRILSCAMSKDMKEVALGTNYGRCMVLDAKTGETRMDAPGFKEGVFWVGFTDDGKRLFVRGNQTVLWALEVPSGSR